MAEDDQKPQENPYLKMMQQDTPQQATTAATPPAETTAPKPSMMQTLGQGALDLGKGAVKGGINTLTNIGSGEHALFPQSLRNTSYGKNFEAGLNTMRGASVPHGIMQNVGHGLEQAGEFLIPGGAEEKLASMAPKAIQPLARIATSALGAGAVNKAQGGSFGTGAAMGAGGAAVGQGMKAIAPSIAEKALGIRGKFDRAFNKAPGEAALAETTGIRPETISNQARARIGELSGQTESIANAASARPNPVRGMLPAPAREIPLHNAPDVEGRLSEPVRLTQADRPLRKMLPEPSLQTPMSSHVRDFPDQLAGGDTGIRPSTSGGQSQGLGAAQYIGQIPGERGGIGQSQGVLIRPQEASGAPLPSTVPNRTASLAPARGVVRQAMGSAENQNAEGLHSQLGGMRDFLSKRFATGEPIPENVTPRELLDLRRGFNEEHGRWNPEVRDAAVTTGRNAYGALTDEFHRVLPEAEPLDQRVANLIPVKNRSQIVATHDNPLQKGLARFGAHTGALTLGTAGAYEGGREHGLQGAVIGGLTGVLAPELIASPEGQMLAARALNKAGGLRGAVGGAAQLTKRKEDENR